MLLIHRNKKNFLSIILSSIFILAISILATEILSTNKQVNASGVSGWNAGRIIDDSIFINAGSMSVSQIQDFLNSKVPSCDTWGVQPSEFGGGTRRQWAEANGYSAPFTCLRDYSENNKSSAQIIYDTAQQFQINPKVLIVLLQKEQSLVTDSWPVSTQYKTATGYGCPDTAACDSQYFGLTNQIQWSARMFRAIMNASPTWYTPYILGENFIQYNPNSSCGGTTVTIQNRATQALYNYTPYQPNQAALDAGWGQVNCGAYGNRNFYLYFQNWFGSTRGNPYVWSLESQQIFSDSSFKTQINDSTNTTKLTPGQKAYVRIRALNTGSETWNANTVKVGTNAPHDRTSPFYDTTWLSNNRVVYTKEPSVAPEDIGTFDFVITAPQQTGTYKEAYTLIYDGVAWFNDIGLYFNIDVANKTSLDEPNLSTPAFLGKDTGLKPGASIKSPDGKYTAIMQSDGNFVIYSPKRALWGTATNGRKVSGIYMQSDGNLVMYDIQGRPIWSSNTWGRGVSSLVMQNDGNLVIYNKAGAIWGSGTDGQE